MGWKPKTIFGKILKGAAIAGGSVLGLATGLGIVGAGAKVVKGTAALTKAKGVFGLRARVNAVGESARNLISGTTKQQRQLINAQKEETRENQQKLNAVEKLVRAGATPEEARAAVGIPEVQLTEFEGEPIQKAGISDIFKNKSVIYIAAGLIGLFLLSKMKR